MYRLLHKLFGWDYIYWQNSCAGGIARIHVDFAGKVWYWQYKNINKARTISESDNWEKILWLTCPREKYLPTRFIFTNNPEKS